ncbi:MAG: hypothetical protein FJW95_01340 [Actinobacteria bacterium]|nr:hypothetical protein [Actinomycetota bacterium]
MASIAEIAEDVAGVVVNDVLGEAAAELSGRSGRKWAVLLLTLLVGAAIAAFVVKTLRDEG